MKGKQANSAACVCIPDHRPRLGYHMNRWLEPSLEWHKTAPSGNSDTVNGRPATGSGKNKPCQFGIPAFMARIRLHRGAAGQAQAAGGQPGDKARL